MMKTFDEKMKTEAHFLAEYKYSDDDVDSEMMRAVVSTNFKIGAKWAKQYFLNRMCSHGTDPLEPCPVCGANGEPND